VFAVSENPRTGEIFHFVLALSFGNCYIGVTETQHTNRREQMDDFTKIPANKLVAIIEAQDKIVREYNEACINAGRGHEKMSEIRESAAKGHDTLAMAYVREMDREASLLAEKARRLRYHGSLKPIKAA
jgi:hypothetical protein